MESNNESQVLEIDGDVVSAAPIIKSGFTYGQALEAAKQGKRIAREGWNGKGMFVFMRPGDVLPLDFIPKVKSLPESVKVFLHAQDRDISFLPYLCMWSATGEVVNGWLASQTDMLSNDWCILEYELPV